MKFLVLLLLLAAFRFGIGQQVQAEAARAQAEAARAQAQAEAALAKAEAAQAQALVAQARAEQAKAEAVQAKAAAAARAKMLSPELQPGVALQAEGQFIDVDVGHAAPFVADVHGDGKLSLLVGQFGGGKLRLYELHKQNSAGYQIGKMEWVKAGTGDCSVPSG